VVPKRILILGGTGFIGPHMVRYAVVRGHEVTIFTRGRTQAEIPEVEHLIGDRSNDLSSLRGRRWDVVLDNNARDYRWVRLSTDLLRDATEQYLFVSSLSAYQGEATGFEGGERVFLEPVMDESSPLFDRPPDFEEGREAPYGLSKTLGEEAARTAFPRRTTIVRPGLIVGPGDPTDRFTYWPVRIHRGGEVLSPGRGNDATQIIDVRDLTEWIVRLAEAGTIGAFNATGPEDRMSMAEMLYGIRAITTTPVSFTWVPVDFLRAQEVRPWSCSGHPGVPSVTTGGGKGSPQGRDRSGQREGSAETLACRGDLNSLTRPPRRSQWPCGPLRAALWSRGTATGSAHVLCRAARSPIFHLAPWRS
jgi:2'-hydroxyisoflavone reductase